MIGAAIRKDLLLVLSDRGGLMALFAMPILFMAVFGSVFGSSDDPVRYHLAVYADPGADPGGRLLAEVSRSPLFDVDIKNSAAAVRADVASGDATAGLIVPRGFDPMGNAPAELSIDQASSAQVQGPIAGELRGRLARAAFGASPSTLLEARRPPGVGQAIVDADGFALAVPGNAVLFGFFLALTIAIAFLEEKHSGTFLRLRAAPVRRHQILWAKLAPYFLVGLVQMVFLFGFGALVLGMRVGGSWLALAVLTVAVVACATSLGLLIASFSGTQKQVGGVGSIVLLVMGLVGGAMVPRVAMPQAMKTAGLFTPHAWALDGYYDLIVRSGTGLADVADSIGMLLLFAVVFAAVGAWRFRFEP